MSTLIRHATLADAAAITEIHCSDNRQWFRFEARGRVPARYEELSLYERWLNGGPWMSLETCTVHLNRLLLAGHFALVAEVDHQVAGEAELYLSDEPQPMGRTLHLSILYVHRAKQRHGAGSKLVREAMELARELSCDTLTVVPEIKPFYVKLGFELCKRLVETQAPTRDHTSRYPAEPVLDGRYAVVRGLSLVIGRYQSPCQAWEELPNDMAIPELRILRAVRWRFQPDELAAYLMLKETVTRERLASASAWFANDGIPIPAVVQALLAQARRMGFTRLELLLEEQAYHHLARQFGLTVQGHREIWHLRF